MNCPPAAITSLDVVQKNGASVLQSCGIRHDGEGIERPVHLDVPLHERHERLGILLHRKMKVPSNAPLGIHFAKKAQGPRAAAPRIAEGYRPARE